MRRPWNGTLMLTGRNGDPFASPTLLPNLDNPIEKKNAEWGAGGAIVGFLVGLIFGSKYTLHTPVRRRRG